MASVPRSTSTAFRPDREVLTAWLLLLLARGEGHGYGLAHELRAHAIDFETTSAYRALRALEQNGDVTSRWIQSGAGPRRRLYSLTPKGRRTLVELAALVTAIRDLHEGFVRAYERAARRDDAGAVPGAQPGEPMPRDNAGEPVTPARSTPPSNTPGALRPEKELLAAWLLLLLDAHASYGYELRRDLDEHGVNADPGAVYRLLRRLDSDGWLQSRWMKPVLGPQRRFYRVTARGRRNLHAIAALIARTRDSHDAFVQAFEQQRTPPLAAGH